MTGLPPLYASARIPVQRARPPADLRPLLATVPAGFQDTKPYALMLPATASVPLVMTLADSPGRPAGFVMGAHDRHVAMDSSCAPAYLEVSLSPLGAYALRGLPMNEIAGRVTDLADLLGPRAVELNERMREQPDRRRRFAMLNDFLRERAAAGPQPAPEVTWAWRRIEATSASSVCSAAPRRPRSRSIPFNTRRSRPPSVGGSAETGAVTR